MSGFCQRLFKDVDKAVVSLSLSPGGLSFTFHDGKCVDSQLVYMKLEMKGTKCASSTIIGALLSITMRILQHVTLSLSPNLHPHSFKSCYVGAIKAEVLLRTGLNKERKQGRQF